MAITQDLLVVLKAQNDTTAAFNGLNKNLNDLKATALKVGSALLGALAIKDVIDSTEQWGTAIRKVQAATGLSAEAASRLAFVAKAMGVDSDELATSLDRLAKQMFSNSVEADKGKDAFSKWGIAIHDAQGNTRNINDVLLDAAAKVRAFGDGAASTALEMDLFGRSGGRMHELLLEGADGIKQLAEESDALGTTLNGQGVSAIKEFAVQSRVLGEAMDGLKVQIGLALMPFLTALVTLLTRLFAWIQSNIIQSRLFAGIIKTLGEAFRVVLGIIKEVTDRIGVFLTAIQQKGIGGAIVDLVTDLMTKVRDGLGATQDWLSVNAPKWTDAIAKLLGSMTDYVVNHPTDLLGDILGIQRRAGQLIGDVITFMVNLEHAMVLAAMVIGLSVGQVILNKLIDVIDAGITLINNTLGKILGFQIPLISHVDFQSNIAELEAQIKALLAPETKTINIIYRTSNGAAAATGGSGGVLDPGNTETGQGGAGVSSGGGSAAATLADIYARYMELTGKEISETYAKQIRDRGLTYGQVVGGNPFLAAGGIVTRPMSVNVGERGPEAIIPLDKGWGGNTIVVNVSGNIATSEDELAERIASKIGDVLVRSTLVNRNLAY